IASDRSQFPSICRIGGKVAGSGVSGQRFVIWIFHACSVDSSVCSSSAIDCGHAGEILGEGKVARSDPSTEASIRLHRYFERAGDALGPIADREPVCLYLETTNRCNLLCTTCPRTFEDLEPPADMSWELFTSIVDQFPRVARAVLHGVGEPMMVRALPRMIRYLKARGVYVLFNTNGTLLTLRAGRDLIDAGLDELRISLDAASPQTFALV